LDAGRGEFELSASGEVYDQVALREWQTSKFGVFCQPRRQM